MYVQYRRSTMSSAQKMKCLIFLGSVRENRLGLRVAKFMEKQLQARNYETELWGKQFCIAFASKFQACPQS